MNASNDEGGAGDDAGRLAMSVPSNGNSQRANSGQNLFFVPSNSNRNENDSAGGLLGENSPPLAPDAFVLAEVGLALPSMTQIGAPPPAAADIESGLDLIADQNQTQVAPVLVDVDGGNEGPPPIVRETSGSSPPANAAARHPAPAATHVDAEATNSSGNTPSQERAMKKFLKCPIRRQWWASHQKGVTGEGSPLAVTPEKEEEAPPIMDTNTILESTERSSTDGETVANGRIQPAGIEEIHSDAADAPIPPGAAEESLGDDSAFPNGKTGHSKKTEGKSIEIVDEDVCPPAQFPFEGDSVMKEKSRTEPEPEVVDDLEMGIETPSNNEQGAAGRPLPLDTDSLDDHVDPIDNIGSPHTTAEADVEAEAEDSSVLHIPHAFLVTQDNQDGTVYDAVHIPNPVPDEPLSWWKQHKNLIGAVSVISVATVIAVGVGSFIASSPRDNEAKSSGDSTSVGLTPQVLPNQSPASLPPTSYLPLPPSNVNSTSVESTSQALPSWSPTSPSQALPSWSPTLLSPARINCTVENFGPLYNESECQSCSHRVGKDGTSLISFKYDILEGAEIQVLSDVNGSLQVSASHTLGDIGDGFTLAFSANLIFTGDPSDSDGGIVYVAPKHSSGSSNDIVTIRPAPGDVDRFGLFGWSIAVDGDVLVVGAPEDLNWAGSAFIFRQTSTGWSEEAKLEPPDLGSHWFGNSVLVKGNLVVVAAPIYGDEGEGAIFFYEFNTSSKSWEPLVNNTLFNDDFDGLFGSSLGFTSDDGLLIGCLLGNDNQGAVYYYQQSDSNRQYIFQQKITTEDGKPWDQFGGMGSHFAISEDGNMFAAAADVGTNDERARVYMFAKFNNVWLEVTKIDEPEGSTNFGGSMAIAENWLLVVSAENTYSYKLTCYD